MTFLSFLSYRWCDTSGNWHSGYPDASCHYTCVQGCNLWGQWSDCTPAKKLDGIVEGTAGNDVINTAYTGDPEGDKIDANDSTDCKDNDDLVHAFGGNDQVAAGLGHDTVYGGDGDDRLDGGTQDDKLYGENGNDTLIGGDGCNTLDGGNGNDVFVGGNGADTFIGGTGQDNLDYSSSTSGVTVNLTTGALSGGQAANDHISSGIDGVIGSNSADVLTGFDHQGTTAADTYTNQFWGNGGNDTIKGLAGNDQLYGGADHDSIEGGSGDDLVDGGTGDDVLYGDNSGTVSGSPVTITFTGEEAYYNNKLFVYTINPTTGAITNVQDLVLNTNASGAIGSSFTYNVAPGSVIGVGIVSPEGTFYSSGYGPRVGLNSDGVLHTVGRGTNADGSVNIGFEDLRNLGDRDFDDVEVKINLGNSGATFDNAHYTYTSSNTTPQGTGNDTIVAGDGNDNVYAGAGNDSVSGDAGHDTLRGEDGNDTMTGGAGDDLLTGGAGTDSLTGGDDRDNFVGGNAGDFVDGSEGGVDNDTLDLRGLAIASIVYDPLNSENGTVNFVGGGTLVFKNIENILRDRDGYVDGTAGGDLINGSYTDPNGDKIDAADALLPGAGPNDDYVRAGDGNDTVLAGEGNDNVFGGNGDDSVEGGNGNDTLNGEAGNDKLYGGEGDDSIVGGNGNDLADGGNGNDVIDTSGSSAIPDATDPNPNDDKDTVMGGAGNDTIRTGDDADSIDGGTGNDSIDAGIDNDTVLAGDGRDTVVGGDGNDVIDSSTGVLADSRPDQGYPGLYPADTDPNNDRDSVDAGNGDDTIRTGDDADTIMAGEGNDSVDAGVDDDVVDAGAGNDTVVGGEGSDTITAGDGADMVYGGFGPGVPDNVNIPDATDALPNNGRDSISGGKGNDTILGLDDADTIDGGEDADVIDGGIDNDLITGGTGDDRIIGGQGADTMSGGADRDVFVSGNAGDSVDGGEDGNDFDTLDLSGSGPLKVIYDALNPENGTVQFLDPTTRVVTGTMSFKNIENVIPCFTPGTLIATPRGEVPVESLRVGDRIITRDNGMQEIRWMGRRDLSWSDLAAAPHLKPILIRQGSLGNNLPERDMLVSPNHRVLVANDRTALYFDEHEVLVAAKHLAAGKGIHSVDAAGASYIHFMCDRHEVVLSNGAWTESFQPGDMTLKGMGNAQRTEIFDLFPELKTDAGIESYTAARRTLKRHEAALIAK